ncbi:hypothetical protein DEU56DRAFT_934849 [Suillus clintonianus]|uniref:uncharacterized protein n=1 Tax=Suillus clintonianus TaxID=1904413 RepID=UPI001B875EA8|nr:uncharacterized protein DEU56DRAFT_934849 [Suillus clintonianus]KAG2112885.1 hypothetical protein DEU56DRAFT_934849 [Suillus clintonianus]
MSQRPPTINQQSSIFLRLHRLLRLPSRTNAVPPIRNDQHRGPLDFPATSPLPHPLSEPTTTQGRSDINSGENSRSLPITQSSATSNTRPHHLSTWWPVRVRHAQPPIVDVPLAQGKERNASADAPQKNDDIVPDEYFDPPSPNPDSQQPAAAAQTKAGEHGGDRNPEYERDTSITFSSSQTPMYTSVQ